MTRRQWLLLIILALVGYGSVSLLFKQYNAAAKWGFAHNREYFVAQAKAFALQNGIEASNWEVLVEEHRNRRIERYLETRPASGLNPVEAAVLTALQTQLKLLPPDRSGQVAFLFAANGQIIDFNRESIKSKTTPKTDQSLRAGAEAALQQLLGDKAQAFALSSEAEPEKGTKKYIWTYTSPNDGRLRFTAEASINTQFLVSLKLKETLPLEFQEELTRRNFTSFALIGISKIIINVIVVLVSLVLFFLGVLRKEIDRRATLNFFAFTALLALGVFYLAGQLDDFSDGIYFGIKSRFILTTLPYILFFFFCFGYALLLTAFWSAGEAISAKYRTGREAVFSAMMRGHIFTRPVAINILAGVLCGSLLVAIPLLLTAVMHIPTLPNEMVTAENFFVSRSPAIAAILESALSNEQSAFHLLILFGFLAPFLGANLKAEWLRKLILLLVGLVFTLDLDPNPTTSIGQKMLFALLTYVVFYLLYRHFDLLATLSASFTAGLLIKGYSFLVQPSPVLMKAGIASLTSLGIFGLVAFVLTLVGNDKQIEQRTIAHSDEDEAERDRLKASFEVARKAQDKMLPSAAPEIQGLSIAAICRPARECGGDLYDFIPMSDGKLGVVVADVSGKGVPAALYMTLTKGLLVSIAEECDDPGEILCAVNKHLYEVCKRKMFVTLFFAIIDPVTKTMSFARAGHNPPVLRRQLEQATKLLQPAGIGLGLNSGKTFDRILKVEQIQLQPNDALILYSDGITEAMNEWQEEYGEERLMKATAITDGMQAEETLSALLADVSFFLGKTAPQDDQTLVVIRVK